MYEYKQYMGPDVLGTCHQSKRRCSGRPPSCLPPSRRRSSRCCSCRRASACVPASLPLIIDTAVARRAVVVEWGVGCGLFSSGFAGNRGVVDVANSGKWAL
eukprot:5062433-Prymnesium_polylepis.2